MFPIYRTLNEFSVTSHTQNGCFISDETTPSKAIAEYKEAVKSLTKGDDIE